MFDKSLVYIPKSISELMDRLAVMYNGPDFSSYGLPSQTIDTVFYALSEGLALQKGKLGEARHDEIADLLAQMRAHFEADPNDDNGRSKVARRMTWQVEDMLLGRTEQPPANEP